MPVFPAFCDSCDTVFDSGFYFEQNANVTLKGNTGGRCPKCGGIGHVPDGVFNFVGNTIQVLSAPERTIEELTRLARIIHRAKANDETREQVASHIEKELPSLAGFVKLLPHNKIELYGLLALILPIILALTQSPNVVHNTTINVNPVIEQVIVRQPHTGRSNGSLEKKSGRNRACSCGSGKRYKKCCGKIK